MRLADYRRDGSGVLLAVRKTRRVSRSIAPAIESRYGSIELLIRSQPFFALPP